MASTSTNGKYLFKGQAGAFLDPDKVLSRYETGRTALGGGVIKKKELMKRNISKQADPLQKDGIIGTFCSIQDANEKFLPEVYKLSELPDRYD